MRKTVITLCWAALLCLAGCGKDEPSTPGGNTPNNPPTPTEPDREGIYSPLARIAEIVHDDSTAAEVWNWQDDRLQSITVDGTEQTTFGFGADGRVADITMSADDMDVTMSIAYTGEYISSLTLQNGGQQVMAAQVDHNADHKVSHATLSISEEYLSAMVSDMGPMMGFDMGDDLSIDSVQGNVDYDWAGNQVSTARLYITFRINTVWGNFKEMASGLSALGIDASMLDALSDDAPIHVKLAIGDTASYTYDSRKNPFKHYLGLLGEMLSLDVTPLVPNNVLTTTHTSGATVTLSTEMEIVPGYSVPFSLPPFSIPMPLESNSSYTYQYNADGYPTSRTDSEGTVTEYHYQQQ